MGYLKEIQEQALIDKIRTDHPPGTKVILIHLNNLFIPVTNRKGVVAFVDEIGCVYVDFAQGALVPLNYRLGDRWEIEKE